MELTSDAANAVNNIVDHFLSNRVVATGVVVGSIFLTADQHLRVEELTVVTSSDFIDRRRIKIDEQRSRNVLAAARLSKKSLERALVADILSIGVGATIGAEAVLQEVARRHPELAMNAPREWTGRHINESKKQHTAPRQSYQAGYQPGQCAGEESKKWAVSMWSGYDVVVRPAAIVLGGETYRATKQPRLVCRPKTSGDVSNSYLALHDEQISSKPVENETGLGGGSENGV